MEILVLLILISIFIIIVMAAAFFWTVKSGQYDDLDGAGHRILMDNDNINTDSQEKNNEDKD